MISTLHAITGPAHVHLECAGRTYRLSDLRLCDWACIECRLLSEPLAEGEKTATRPPERSDRARSEDLDRAKCQTSVATSRNVWTGELFAYIRSAKGREFVSWLMLRRHHPELTYPRAQEIFHHVESQTLKSTAIALAQIIRSSFPAAVCQAHFQDGRADHFGEAVPWQFLFRRSSERFGWTPGEVSELTLVQMSAYFGPDLLRPQYRWMSPAEAQELKHRRRVERDPRIEEEPLETDLASGPNSEESLSGESRQAAVAHDLVWIDVLASAWEAALRELANSLRVHSDSRPRYSAMLPTDLATPRGDQTSQPPTPDFFEPSARPRPLDNPDPSPGGDDDRWRQEAHIESLAGASPRHAADSDLSPAALERPQQSDADAERPLAHAGASSVADHVSRQPDRNHGSALNVLEGRLGQLHEHCDRLDRIAHRLEKGRPMPHFGHRTSRFV